MLGRYVVSRDTRGSTKASMTAVELDSDYWAKSRVKSRLRNGWRVVNVVEEDHRFGLASGRGSQLGGTYISVLSKASLNFDRSRTPDSMAAQK